MTTHTILMADIVHSSNFEGRSDQLMSDFKQLVADANRQFRVHILSPLTITLGDEFQGIPDSLESAIQLIIGLEETRISQGFDFQLRYVLQQGDIETPINKKSAHEMLGAGLTAARKNLEKLKNRRAVRQAVYLREPVKGQLLDDLLLIYFSLVDDWRISDYPLITAFLEGLDYPQAARKLKRERTSTLRKYRSLKIVEYEAVKRILHAMTKD